MASGTRPENPGRIKEVRRTIARILTIEHEQRGKKPVEAAKPVAKAPAKPKVAAKPAEKAKGRLKQKNG